MMRFIVIDTFGDALRRFNTKQEAQAFIRNKRDFTLREISLHDLLGDCLL